MQGKQVFFQKRSESKNHFLRECNPNFFSRVDHGDFYLASCCLCVRRNLYLAVLKITQFNGLFFKHARIKFCKEKKRKHLEIGNFVYTLFVIFFIIILHFFLSF
jgi:hypothetical protein